MSTAQAGPAPAPKAPPNTLDDLLLRQNQTRLQLVDSCEMLMRQRAEYDQGDVVLVNYDALYDVVKAFRAMLGLVDILEAGREAACDHLAGALAREDPVRHLSRDGVDLAVRMIALEACGIDVTTVEL